MSPATSASPSSCTSLPIPSRPGQRATLEDMLPRDGKRCCSKLQCGAFTGGSRDSSVLVFSVSVCSSFILEVRKRTKVNGKFEGHDAGHTSLYENNKVNNAVGFFLHSVRSFYFLR